MLTKAVFSQRLRDEDIMRLDFEKGYTWASGIQSPIYTDMRKLYGIPELRDEVIAYFEREVLSMDFDYIAGVATGGIGYGAIVADRLRKPFVYVRAQAKDHGLGQAVEGASNLVGKRVVVIEDVVSTGGSLKNAIAALQQQGAQVIWSGAVFTYHPAQPAYLSFGEWLDFIQLEPDQRAQLQRFAEGLGDRA